MIDSTSLSDVVTFIDLISDYWNRYHYIVALLVLCYALSIALSSISTLKVYWKEHQVRPDTSLLVMRFASMFLAVAAGGLVLFLTFFSSRPSGQGVDQYSWAQLSDISDEIAEAGSQEEALAVASSYGLVDSSGKLDGTQLKEVKLNNGIETTVQLIGIYHDIEDTGARAGLTFAFADAVDEHAMNNDRSTNDGGWGSSDMREWLNADFSEQLPDDLREVITPVQKYTNNVGQASDVSCVSATLDSLWLLSVTECIGDTSVADVWTDEFHYLTDISNSEGTQYKLFQDARITAVKNSGLLLREFVGDSSSTGNAHGVACQWWLRSPSASRNDHFASEFAGDEPDGNTDARTALGVVPCFCV